MAEASLNPAVLAFTTALALVTGLVFGLVPAIADHARQHQHAAEGRHGARIGGARAPA